MKRLPLEAGAAACELLGLDPASVSAIGFEAEAAGYVRVRVELLVELDLARRLAGVLLGGEESDGAARAARLTRPPPDVCPEGVGRTSDI